MYFSIATLRLKSIAFYQHMDTFEISRHGDCEVCKNKASKYTCPRCEIKSCSLHCSKLHKEILSCSGLRNRTKFIPLDTITENDFQKDLYFLQECTRFVDKVGSYLKQNSKSRNLPIKHTLLRSAAYKRRVTLKFLPKVFVKSKNNTSFFDTKSNKIFWRVEMVIDDIHKLKLIEEHCDENVRVIDLIINLIHKSMFDFNQPKTQLLEYYLANGKNNLNALLKSETVKGIYKLNVTKSLKENLCGKTVVEYPCIWLTCNKTLRK